MKTKIIALLASATISTALCLSAMAQNYSIDWHKIAGGGGTSTNGSYSISGTIGQPDASGIMNGGSYTLVGGFWSLFNVIQTAGLPNLSIVGNGVDSLKVLWSAPSTNSYTLQQTVSLSSPMWTNSSYSIINANGTNSITVTPITGSLFFRLKN